MNYGFKADIGFIILCPNKNVTGLKNSLFSINRLSYGRESICIVGNNASAKEMKDFKNHCPTFKGKDTITSLINTGMKKLQHDWGFFLFAGSNIQSSTEKLIATFLKSENDVIFPIVDGKTSFAESSFNGVMIHKEFFKKTGGFSEYAMEKQGVNDFEFAKFFWADSALSAGAQFKGILGLRIL